MKLSSLLKESYGIMKFEADLQNWASQNKVPFKKISAQKKPGSYGSTISDRMYQVGNLFVLSRYSTTPGAPRLNELKMWVLDAPNTKANVITSLSFIDTFDRVAAILSREIKSAPMTAGGDTQTWTKASIEKLLRDLAADKQYRNFNDAEAFETAQAILDDHPGLEDAVQSIYKIQDVTGWLANRI